MSNKLQNIINLFEKAKIWEYIGEKYNSRTTFVTNS